MGAAAAVVLTCLAAGPAHQADAVARVRTADPTGTPLLRETFTGAAAPEFTGYNEACLTGAPAGTPSPGDHELGGCEPPSLTLEKRLRTPGPHHAGQPVRFSYLVTNTGGVALDHIHVTDDHVSDVTCAATTLAPSGSPGDHTTCHGTYVITEADAINGMVTNTAVAAGSENGRTINSPPSRQTLLIGPARLTLRKRAAWPGPYVAGGTVGYKYVVTNTGSRTLHGVAVIDDRVTNVTCAATTLAPGQSTVCRGTYRVTAQDARLGRVTNFAQAAGTDSHGEMFVSKLATATIRVKKKKCGCKPRLWTGVGLPAMTAALGGLLAAGPLGH